MKRNYGITLIALVVTIVVLLIIAGISISMLSEDNGIISQAKDAKELSRYDNVNEAYEIWQVEQSTGTNSKSKKEFIEDLGPNGTMKYLTEEEVKEIYDTGKITIANKTIIFFVKVDTLTLENNEITIIKNGTAQLNILEDINGVELKWNSSDPEKVSINNGKLRGIQKGQATITCSAIDDENVKAECNVHVVDASEIYGEVDDGNLIFKEIPNNTKLEIWSTIRSAAQMSNNQIANPNLSRAPYICTVDSNTLNDDLDAYVDIFYRLKDNYENLTELYHFYLGHICFVKDTLISTPSGKIKIQDIKTNDIVYSMNMETNQIEEKRVEQTFTNEVKYNTIRIYTSNACIECTTGHEIYTTNRGWVKAYYLNKGDILLTESNQENPIDKVEYIYNEKEITVYNFEVQDNHNYFVSENSILVHNPPTSTTCSIETGTIFRGSIYEIE